MSRSRRIVASSFELRAWSACSAIAFRRAGVSSSDVLEHSLERAVLRDQLRRGLVADSRDAGDVVGGVALQADEVGHLVGRDPQPRLDALGRVDVDVRDAARGHHQADVVGDELERVAVGRDDACPDRRPRPPGSRAWRSRRRPPSPRTRGCGSRTPRRSAGRTGTAPGGGPASAGGPACTRRRAPPGARAACPTPPRRPSAGSRRAA